MIIYIWLYIYMIIYTWLYMDISNDVHVVFSMVFPFESPFSGRSSPWGGALEETSWWMPWLSKAADGADGRMRWVKMPRYLWKWLNMPILPYVFFYWSYLIMLYHFRWCSPYLWICFGYARLISFPELSSFFGFQHLSSNQAFKRETAIFAWKNISIHVDLSIARLNC